MTLAQRIGVAGLLILALESLTLLPLRGRQLIAIYAAVLLLLVWLRRHEIFSARSLVIALAAGFVVSMVPVLTGGFLGYEDPRQAVLRGFQPTVVGWCTALVLLPLMAGGAPDDRSRAWKPSVVSSSLFLAGSFAVLAISHYLAVRHLAVVSDEVVFLTQARWMQFPQVAWPLDADIAPFFRMRKVDYLNGQMVGMYPPGWPAMLASFRYLGLEWWSSVIVGTVSVWLTYLVGARLKGPRAGAIAATLLATSQVFLMNLAGYMSHGAIMMGLLGATWTLLTGLDQRGWRRAILWMCAGAFFAFCVTVRPLTGLGIGLSIGLWMLARTWRKEPRAVIAMAACVAVGGLLPLWLFIYYNLEVFGKPIALGHEVMHPGLYSLGFGQRGFRVLDENLNWVPSTFYHGPVAGFRTLVRRLVGINTTFVPIGLLAPIMALALAAGFRIRWGLVAAFSILPAALFFYWSGQLRQYVELLPFIFMGVAAMLLAIHERWPRLALGLTGAVVASQLIVALPWNGRSGYTHRPWAVTDYGTTLAPGRWPTLIEAERLAREHGRVLLFSREQGRFDNQIDRLYIFNGDGLDGPILVARDLGPRNAELIKRFPDRVPFLVVDPGRDKVATFTRINP
ncbi:MAG TPA: hypothetical protein VF128_14675 [Gemmatimonadaceae bacterium]